MNEIQGIDNAIGQVERLYRSLTGLEAPPIREEPYAMIPPEKVPEEHVQEQVDRLVETLSQFSTGAVFEGWKPPISIWEGPNEVLVAADLPGVTRESVHVSVANGMLEIHGVRPVRTSQDSYQATLKYAENAFGKFRRMIPLPAGIYVDQLQAEIRNGVLEIRIPRTSGSHDVKSIHVS